MKNVEIKAKCSDPQKIRDILRRLKADFIGKDHQVDTYFNVSTGRLKLREGNIETALIYYQRSDSTQPKLSKVLLYTPENPQNLKEILIRSLGIKIIVEKTREIYFIENVKFHIDQVKGLGSFIEIEAQDRDNTFTEKQLLDQCKKFMELFQISEKELVSTSYSDLLLKV